MSYYQQHNQNYHPYNAQPQYYEDDYALQPMQQHNHVDPYYQNDYHNSSAVAPHLADDHAYGYSDTKALTPPPASRSYLDKDYGDDDDERRSRSCLDCICCGCCSCCPMWVRWCACFLLLIVIALGITIGVLAALFKKPQVNFNGITQDSTVPPVQQNGSSFDFNFDINIGVVNPNIESATFTSIQAIAYYPTAPTVPVGGGILDDVHIASNSNSNFSFPFTITYDPSQPNGSDMMFDIAKKCGILGGTPGDITINYKLIVTVDIIGIKISPSIDESATFPCPLSAGNLPSDLTNALNGLGSGGGLGGLASDLPSGIAGLLPSDISGNSMPSGIIPSGVSLPSSVPSGI
ncbi:hypothetical protein INT43_002935 [Umbelopsis isabellina]|uniref:Late embryogenesis abundant protein LEA-2 subgroup domain-containing protein n=1 Tax=Mortierella isabellina TaxID=91625 RepID=A0A8H7PCF3_MORIS|nr:hypothetical protein INT43_002935 [Umbelopsis isabellina]